MALIKVVLYLSLPYRDTPADLWLMVDQVEPIWGRMISSMMYEVMNLTTRTHTISPPCFELLWLMLRYGCLM